MLSFGACVFDVISKKSFSNSRSQRSTSMFSSKNFTVLPLKFSSMIHFELIFVYGMRQGSNFTILQVDTQLSQHYLLKTVFPSFSCLGTFVENLLSFLNL